MSGGQPHSVRTKQLTHKGRGLELRAVGDLHGWHIGVFAEGKMIVHAPIFIPVDWLKNAAVQGLIPNFVNEMVDVVAMEMAAGRLPL